jgi:hypothetical protein
MRSFFAVLAVGLVALVAVSLTQKSSLVYSLGVNPGLQAAQIGPGVRACQRPVRVPSGAAFDRVGFAVTPVGESTLPVRVEVREARGGRTLATGRLAPGYAAFDPAHPREEVVDVGRVETDEPLELCLTGDRNGEGSAVVIGQAGIASPSTSATLDGKPIAADLTFELRTHDRSLAALLPDIADRASEFRAGWVTPAVYLLLALAILIGAPLLLGRGLARAAAEDQRSTASTPRQ